MCSHSLYDDYITCILSPAWLNSIVGRFPGEAIVNGLTKLHDLCENLDTAVWSIKHNAVSRRNGHVSRDVYKRMVAEFTPQIEEVHSLINWNDTSEALQSKIGSVVADIARVHADVLNK